MLAVEALACRTWAATCPLQWPSYHPTSTSRRATHTSSNGSANSSSTSRASASLRRGILAQVPNAGSHSTSSSEQAKVLTTEHPGSHQFAPKQAPTCAPTFPCTHGRALHTLSSDRNSNSPPALVPWVPWPNHQHLQDTGMQLQETATPQHNLMLLSCSMAVSVAASTVLWARQQHL